MVVVVGDKSEQFRGLQTKFGVFSALVGTLRTNLLSLRRWYFLDVTRKVLPYLFFENCVHIDGVPARRALGCAASWWIYTIEMQCAFPQIRAEESSYVSKIAFLFD